MKKIHLMLTGRQRGEDGAETVTKTCALADYYDRNGSHYILYEEHTEDTGIVSRNVLKLKNGLLELTKRGAVSSHMVFEAGKEYCTDYSTPYGHLEMEIATRSVTSTFRDGIMEIKVDYTLSSDGRFLSACTLIIEAKPL